MSSMRNAVQRRSHRERAQPLERQRLGMLEKHKDYSLRAKDHNKKKTQLKSLRQKAAERNEDEFYFGMMSRQGAGTSLSRGRAWTGTIDGDRGNKALDVETVRLLKTQDMGYLRTMRNVAAKEVAALRERVILAGGGADLPIDAEDDEDEDREISPAAAGMPRKIVFTDDVEERDQILSKQDQTEDDGNGSDAETEADKKAEVLAKLQRRLQTARRKLRALTGAETELEAQRAKMAKTPSYSGITKSGKKVKARERKR